MKSKIIQLGLTQMTCSADAQANEDKQAKLLEEAAKAGGQILCTQEIYRGQYFCQIEDHRFFETAEPIPGPSTERFSKIAKQYGVVIVASLFEKRASGLYHNTAAVIDADGSLLGIYRKMHIPDDPLYYEKFYFTPGDTGFRAWKTKFATIGVLICWDQWFPEGARLTAMQGAEVLFYPTAIGWHPAEKAEFGHAQHDAWETSMRAHAIANGCYVAAANRIGHELVLGADGNPVNDDGIQFWGQSFLAKPDGQVQYRASVDKEEVIVQPIDLQKVEFSRTHWPFLRDRRVDAYGDITKRFIGP
ncbi:MAG: carbon-nitrogen hydrolase [Tepidisphaeraceae bacterium]